MQFAYFKNFSRSEANKLQNILLENIYEGSIAQRIIYIILFGYSYRGKIVFKESVFHLYYRDFIDLS